MGSPTDRRCTAVLETAAMLRRPGRWQLHAAIAACHSDTRDGGDPDWLQVLTLYDMLLAYDRSPVVRLNRAVALAEVDGPRRHSHEVDALRQARPGIPPVARRSRADAAQVGRRDEAIAADLHALELTANDAERRLLDLDLGRGGAAEAESVWPRR